jgi:hypothetical protein
MWTNAEILWGEGVRAKSTNLDYFTGEWGKNYRFLVVIFQAHYTLYDYTLHANFKDCLIQKSNIYWANKCQLIGYMGRQYMQGCYNNKIDNNLQKIFPGS